MNEQILLVEDDVLLREGLVELFTKQGYFVTAVGSVSDAKEKFANGRYNLIILDVMLPDGNGYDLCESIRRTDTATPILFLTSCDDEFQIVKGLDVGGDDYVTKPFKLLELLSRVRALLRRNGNTKIGSCDIILDTERMTVRKNSETICVTPTEFQILTVLLKNSGIIVTRTALLQNIWDDSGNFIDDNTLSVHISRLREKIGSEHIGTVRGVGYRWEE